MDIISPNFIYALMMTIFRFGLLYDIFAKGLLQGMGINMEVCPN